MWCSHENGTNIPFKWELVFENETLYLPRKKTFFSIDIDVIDNERWFKVTGEKDIRYVQ